MGAGKIFINYRREDSKAWSLLVYKVLEPVFGAERLFYDIDTIPPGEDFVEYLNAQVSKASVLLALIGDRWLTATNPETGQRRLDDPDDFVRIEIAAALANPKIRVIPVMLDQTPVPAEAALPAALAPLARRNALGLTHQRFDADMGGLTRALETALQEAESRQAAEAARATQVAEARAAEDAAAAREAARAVESARLSPDAIAKAEEMANWQFIQAKDAPDLLRDHLARFPNGPSQPWAQERLEALTWERLDAASADAAELDAFLAEFPNGPNAAAAAAKRDRLRAEAEAEADAAAAAWAAVKDSIDPAALNAFAQNHPDSPHAAAATELALHWDRHGLKQIAELRGHTDTVRSAVFNPDGTRLATASDDTTARLWDAKTGAEIAVLDGRLGEPPQKTGPLLRLIRANGWTTNPSHRGHTYWVFSAAFSPDGTRLATVSADETARLWDAKTGAEIAVLRGHTNWVRSAVFNPDGTRLATASADKTARLWYAGTGAEIAVLRGHTGPVHSEAFSPDGTRLATASRDKTARLWDAKTGAEIAVLRGHTGPVHSAAFSPDGTQLATASADETARLWNVVTGADIAVLRGHTGPVHSTAFSPDGTRLATASDDETARLWDAETGAEIAVLRGHTDWVRSAVFNPDGTRLATASDDKTARLWDAETGAEVAVLHGHSDDVNSAAFSPDGTRLVTASDDGTARLWHVGAAAR